MEYRLCLNCGKEIPRGKLKNSQYKIRKYCNANCRIEHQQKQWEERWLNGEINGNKDTVWTQVSVRTRKYLFKKYNNKCARCEWGEVNPYTNKIPLEVEHIDGNPYNTTPDNVTLLCPNCHSLTKSYRGANRGNGRKKTWIPLSE